MLMFIIIILFNWHTTVAQSICRNRVQTYEFQIVCWENIHFGHRPKQPMKISQPIHKPVSGHWSLTARKHCGALSGQLTNRQKSTFFNIRVGRSYFFINSSFSSSQSLPDLQIYVLSICPQVSQLDQIQSIRVQ